MESLESEDKQVMYDVVQKEEAFVSETEVNDKSSGNYLTATCRVGQGGI